MYSGPFWICPHCPAVLLYSARLPWLLSFVTLSMYSASKPSPTSRDSARDLLLLFIPISWPKDGIGFPNSRNNQGYSQRYPQEYIAFFSPSRWVVSVHHLPLFSSSCPSSIYFPFYLFVYFPLPSSSSRSCRQSNFLIFWLLARLLSPLAASPTFDGFITSRRK